MPMRILLIDDDAVDRLVVRRALRQVGLEADVRETVDGTTGLQILREETFDCVLLDYRLPDMDGLEFLHALSAMLSNSGGPIVMLTGQGSEAIAVAAMKYGVHDYLVKDGLEPEALQRAILTAIEVAKLQSEHRQAQDALRQQREWFEVTLASIGDAVLATDVSGVITFLNPVAEALTGWAAGEALGRPFAEVFRIIHEATRQPLDSPVSRVLREGRAVGLENHTALLTRDGREVAIADNGAPIRSSAGQLYGVVLVFRGVAV